MSTERASNAARDGGASPPTSGSRCSASEASGRAQFAHRPSGQPLLGSLQRAIPSNALLGSRDGLQMLWGSLRLERKHWRAWSGTLAGMTWGDGGESSATYSTLNLNLTLFFVNYDSSTPSAPGGYEPMLSLALPLISMRLPAQLLRLLASSGTGDGS